MIASAPSVYPAPVVYPALQPAFLTAELPKPDKPLLQPTREENKPATPSTTLTGQVSQTAPPGTPPLDKTGKLPRTKGEYAFDVMLYPMLAYGAVFGLSVLFTYLSNHGSPTNFLKVRGDNWRKFLQGEPVKLVKKEINHPLFKFLNKEVRQPFFKLSEQTAKDANMLTWSFIDGTAAAPMVKWFEDRREPIARKFDQWMGTTPDDDSVYKQEPRQSGFSVLGGRAVAASAVLPTFKLLQNHLPNGKTWNQTLLSDPGEKLGAWVEDKAPALKSAFPKIKFPAMGEVVLFEAAYTMVTTAALYFSSRFFASHHSEKPAPKPLANPPLINATV